MKNKTKALKCFSEQQLEKMANLIKGLKDYRHMSIVDIGMTLGFSANYISNASVELRQRGMIEPKSDIGMTDLRRYRQLDKLMATNPKTDLAVAVLAIYGEDTKKARYKLRYLIESCRTDGLDISHIKQLKVDPINHGHCRPRQSTLRYIKLAQVEPQALAAFVGICQMNGGRHAA
ncbi:hypothetical protein Q7I37_12915 [Aeromonas allosaccharophila]|uniref:hypothetical protein n=1 Tax=Aeromonas allosaccharophila TaxID=656 RepID=UPI0030046BD4